MDRINDVIRKRKRLSFFYPICTFIAFGCLYVSSSKFIEIINISLYELASVMFCLFIVAVTLFFKIGNPILSWLGKHVFEIYILQRLPMILFQNKVTNKYLYFMICLIFTILISILFSKIEKITDGLLFDKRVKWFVYLLFQGQFYLIGFTISFYLYNRMLLLLIKSQLK